MCAKFQADILKFESSYHINIKKKLPFNVISDFFHDFPFIF